MINSGVVGGKGGTKYSLPVSMQIGKAILKFSVAILPKARNECTT